MVTCPKCGNPAKETSTRYGVRHSCCGLHSWGGKELVSTEVHAARRLFHDTFDPIWQGRKCNRNKAYQYLSVVAGLPEHECHGAKQTDLEKLRIITEAAALITPQDVNKWW